MAVYLVAYYLYTYPATHTFSTHILADGGDGPQNLWNNWWVRFAVANGQSPWWTDFLHHPYGTSLVTATLNPFNGFCTVPLCALGVGQVAAFNVMVVASFVLTGWGMFLLARELTGSYWGSVLAGAVLTFSPFHLAHAFGHMQLVSLEWLPVFLFCWVRLLRRPTHPRALAAAAVLLLVLLCDYYYTMYAVVTGALLFGFELLAHRATLRRYLVERVRPLVTFTVSSLVLCGPLCVALLLQLTSEPHTGEHDAKFFGLDLLAPLIPGRMWRFASWTEFFWAREGSKNFPLEFASHLGLSVILLAGYAVVRSWRGADRADTVRWLWIGGLFFSLSLGVELRVLGTPITGLTPYAALERLLPVMRYSGMPSRMSIITTLAAAVLAARGFAFAAQRLRHRYAWLLAVPLVALFVFDTLMWEQPTFRPEIPPVIEKLADLPRGCVVGLEQHKSRALYMQTVMRQPIPSGYVARVPVQLEHRAMALADMARRGEYDQLVEKAKADYLLREVKKMPPVRSPALRRIAADHLFELFVREENPLGELLLPGLPGVFLVRNGESSSGRTLLIRSKPDAGCRFVVWLSRSDSAEGFMFQGHRIPLRNDGFVAASFKPNSVALQGNWGVLDDRGEATVRVAAHALRPDESRLFWVCLSVFDGTRMDRTRRVYPPVQIDFSR
ncbi:MAG: hypothetical protein KDC87_07435 [Planctomycetes bacterium]|nr:hypothetical protein [Planctomycetota bacterium]